MKDSYLLSIIIPVYNVEKYIMKCVSSILEQILLLQDKDPIEIIIVNDGTKDNSIKIITDYISHFDFVKVLNQENRGLSAARNYGLRNATGKYVWFFDSDDYLNDNTLGSIVASLKNSSDLHVIGMQSIDENNKVLESCVFEKVCKPLEFIKSNKFMAVLYIVRRQVLLDNDIFFHEGIYHEDVEFTPRMLCYINTYSIIEKKAYCYLKRLGSITMGNGKDYNPKRANDTFTIVKSLSSFREKLPFADRKIFSRIISLIMNNILQDIPNMNESTMQEVRVLFKNNKGYFIHLLKAFRLKYALEWTLFSLFPSKTIEIFSFMKFKKIYK